MRQVDAFVDLCVLSEHRMHTDAPDLCSNCGYDLRGLPPERPCPECGAELAIDGIGDVDQQFPGFQDSPFARWIVPGDLAGMPDVRRRFRVAMTLAGFCVLGFTVVQAATTIGFLGPRVLDGLVLVLVLVWPVAVLGTAPRSCNPSMPPFYRSIRSLAVVLAWSWSAWYLVDRSGAAHGAAVALLGLAGLSAAIHAIWLHGLALRMDQFSAAWRFNLIAWSIPTVGFLIMILPGTTRAAAPIFGHAMYIYFIVYVAMLIGWAILLVLYARSLMQLGAAEHTSIAIEQTRKHRQARIAAKRAALDKKASLRRPGE